MAPVRLYGQKAVENGAEAGLARGRVRSARPYARDRRVLVLRLARRDATLAFRAPLSSTIFVSGVLRAWRFFLIFWRLSNRPGLTLLAYLQVTPQMSLPRIIWQSVVG